MKVAGISFVAPLLLVLFTLVAFSTIERAEASESMTPLLLSVQDAPVPFMGSDGRVHLVYELEMNNFSSAEITVEKVEVISDGATLQTLDTAAVAGRLQPGGPARFHRDACQEHTGAALSQRRPCYWR